MKRGYTRYRKLDVPRPSPQGAVMVELVHTKRRSNMNRGDRKRIKRYLERGWRIVAHKLPQHRRAGMHAYTFNCEPPPTEIEAKPFPVRSRDARVFPVYNPEGTLLQQGNVEIKADRNSPVVWTPTHAWHEQRERDDRERAKRELLDLETGMPF